MDIHLYLMCYRTEALVASHLSAEEFGSYMAVGTRKKTFGNVMFFEIDSDLDSQELNLDKLQERCTVHSDGSPRHSKYMSVYRVMEHIPLSAYGKLYLTTRDGLVLPLEGQPYEGEPQPRGPYMYAELCPLTSRVVTALDPALFTRRITDPSNAFSVPRIFFAETKASRDAEGRMAGYLPYRNPSHIEDCLREVEEKADKLAKTVDRDPPLVAFYRTIHSGFYIGDQSGIIQYPYPDITTFDEEHHIWARSASMG